MEGDEEGNNDKETTKTFLYCMKLKERLSTSHEYCSRGMYLCGPIKKRQVIAKQLGKILASSYSQTHPNQTFTIANI
jgi:hypothetical protein